MNNYEDHLTNNYSSNSNNNHHLNNNSSSSTCRYKEGGISNKIRLINRLAPPTTTAVVACHPLWIHLSNYPLSYLMSGQSVAQTTTKM